MTDSLHLQYRSALNDLTHRAEKVIINNLTTIAMENIELAPIIVKAIEDQLFNAHPSLKLPLIYLMDSILKNIGKNYIPSFQKNIVSTFMNAYTQVHPTEKEKLKRVLYTWRANPGGFLFPSSILSQIESAIGVGSKPAQRSAMPPAQHAVPRQIPSTIPSGETISQTSILQQIQQLVNQKETMRILQPTSQTLNTEISVLRQLAQVLSSQRLDFATLNQIKNQIQPMMTSSAPAPQSNFLPSPSLNLSTPVGLQSLAALSGPIGLSSLSVAQLGSLDFLQSFPTNSIKGSSSISSPLLGLVQPVKKEQVVPAIIPKDVPIIRLDSSDINKRHPGLYYHLYEAIELQCKQCALRFPSHTIQGGKATLEAHLDWHFRQKKKQKEKNKRAISRDWYLTADDWLAEQPIDPISDNQVAPVFFGQEAEAVLVTMSVIPASATQTKCYICQETLEKYFDDEEDMWMVRGAVKSGEKMYHENCYKDSSVQGTPVLGKRSIELDVLEAKKVKIEPA